MPFRSFGALELGIIAFVILMIFGAGKLPEVGSTLGKGIWKFRRAVSGEEDEEAPGGGARPNKVVQGTDPEERAKAKGR